MAKSTKRKIKKQIKKELERQVGYLGRKYKIRFTKYDSNSRKGKYIVIKNPLTDIKGVYKIKKGLNTEDYVSKLRKREDKLKDSSRYLTQLRRTKRIDDTISVGMKESSLLNARKLDRASIKKGYTEMLGGLVSDKQLLNVLTSEENIKKMKNRIEIKLFIEGEDNKIITFSSVGNTLEEIYNKVKITLSHGDFYKKDIDNFKKVGLNLTDEQNVNLKEYDKPIINKIKSAKIKLIYRKGR